jgi:hypothetical protein
MRQNIELYAFLAFGDDYETWTKIQNLVGYFALRLNSFWIYIAAGSSNLLGGVQLSRLTRWVKSSWFPPAWLEFLSLAIYFLKNGGII